MVALSFKSLSILIALILRVSYSDALLFSRDLPCDFLDSVNITGGVLHSNNSFIFNGIEFTVGQYTKVNYIVKDGQFLIVEPYYRGCPCKNKPCIRLCCPYASFVVSKKADGEFICRNDEAARRIEGEIINENNETEIINFEQHFGFVERVCINHYYADEFQITHDGYILSEDERFDHREYCLEVKQNETEVNLHPLICFEKPNEYHPRYRILPYVMLATIPFIIATILIYLFIPDLMSLFGKCLVSFLISLLIYYIALSYVHLNVGVYVAPLPCTVLAYTIYFAYISVALWLNVISFNAWQSFRFIMIQRKRSDRKQFIFYALYVYTLSTMLTVASGVIDSIDSLPNHLKPGFGVENCFIKDNRTSLFLYFYLQISIIFCANIVFIILTTLKIHRLSQELESAHRSSFNHKKFSYMQYLRLFLLLGVTWSMDAVSYIDLDGIFSLLSDICNCAQGIVIFILLVLNKRVFLQIKERWRVLFGGNASTGTRSTTTSCSSNKDRSREGLTLNTR